MISVLTNIFIKDKENYNDTKVRRSYGMLCSIFGIFLNIVLFSIKLFAGLITGSVAIVADAFNNLSDAGSSLITLVGFKFAGMKPDTDHPFGHGRIEYISGLIVSLLIVLMGFELGKGSIEKIIEPEKVNITAVAIVILLISIVIKIYMAFYNFNVGKKINSSAMKATGMDSLSDVIATTVVFLSMGIIYLFKINVDGICGVLVAAFILWAGFQAAKETVSPLLGVKPSKEFVDEIEKIVMSYDEIVGVHDLVVHDYGPGRVMISLHAEVPGDKDIYKLHDIIDNAECELNEKLGCEAVIHMDPIEVNNEIVVAMRKNISDLVIQYDKRLSIHDFRMVTGQTHTNVIFDVVTPQEYELSNSEIEKKIKSLVEEKYPNHYVVIKVEKEYI